MGVKLTAFFEQANKEFGPIGRMKLAMLTQIASAKAETEADSPDNVRKFEQAMVQMRKSA
jgi:hypothetical protein